MNRAKRAIILAAGRGQRMRPITLHTPKPLIKVNGKRIIDTIIDSLHENGIEEIIIVIGYLKDKFMELKNLYLNISFIENPYYNKCNNISSLYMAREYLEDTIIIDGDQIIYNSHILNPEFKISSYCCAWTNDLTNEWLLTVEQGVINHCSRTGGSHGWQLYSVSFWSKEDGIRLRKHLEQVFLNEKKTDIYWDDVALFCFHEYYQLGIREINKNDILEIDTINELIKLDSTYADYI